MNVKTTDLIVQTSWSSVYNQNDRRTRGVRVVLKQHFTGSAGQINQVVNSLQEV